MPDQRILIAGAGVAGLTAALAFAQRGFTVAVFEQAQRLEEIGAGIQLSPNATRILGQLGVLQRLDTSAVRPDAVVLRRAADLVQIAQVPLGDFAERRWGAPYLVAHRADLQAALLDAVAVQPAIRLVTGTIVKDFSTDAGTASLSVEVDGQRTDETGLLAIGADGVWSTMRGLAGESGLSRFIGQLAWRRTISANDEAAKALPGDSATSVTAFLHRDFHLISYPVRGGSEINLVAFTKSRRDLADGWTQRPDNGLLTEAMRQTSPALVRLARGGDWTAWPIHVADLDGAWTDSNRFVLIGDAAHAMTPFAAQGAAMAIEDAATLASAVTLGANDRAAALNAWATERRRRVLRVARRGALNQFAWHAWGPVAVARDMVLKMRGSERLAADLDWLYGWEAPDDGSL